MRSITPALDLHLDQEVTSLASCWKIVRRDGTVFCFTDHDRDLTVAGELYEAESSYSRTAIASNSDLSVDNLDVAGMIDSERLSEDDLRNGLFNRADVYVFIVNWQSPDDGILKVRRGWFGEVTVNQNGTFEVEIRGLAQALSYNTLETFAPECRADFCDARCKLNIADFTHSATVTGMGATRDRFIASGVPDGGTVGESVGAHRTWSLYPTAYHYEDKFAFAEIRFRDQNGALITGGTAGDSIGKIDGDSTPLDDYEPKYARDGRANTMWKVERMYKNKGDPDEEVLLSPAGHRWIISWSTAKDIASVEIISTADKFLTPTAWKLMYSDDTLDSSVINWTLAKDCVYTWAEGGQSAIWELGSDSDQPGNVDIPESALPSPSNGVSTYVGGTIKWLTGRNMGRIVEITDFVPETGEVEMFESMYYPVSVGDQFEIAQGCDKTLLRCQAYDNVINRRAEDFVPGQDELVSYPDAN